MKRKFPIRQRPFDFRINPGHSFANGLQFAALGRFAGNVNYYDSSINNTATVLSGFTTNGDYPYQQWQYNSNIGRWTLNFDGINDTIIIPNYLKGLSKWTLGAWFKPVSGRYLQILDARATETYKWFGACLYANYSSSYMRCDSGISGHSISGNLTNVFDGNFHHAMLTFNSTRSPCMELFIDGKIETTSVNNIVAYDVSYMNTTALIQSSVDPSYSYGFVSDVLIYNRILTLEEINQLADPSNIMLSNLILTSKRKYFPIIGINIKKYSIFQSSIFDKKKYSNIVRGSL
jgi:hypothetical protein